MIAALIIAAALAADAPLSSEAAFEAFKTLCVATGADPAAVATRAEALGFSPVPEEARKKVASGAENPATVQVRARRAGGQVLIVSADRSDGTILGAPLSTNNCQFNVPGGDYARLLALAKAWAAVPASTRVGADPSKGVAFVFADNSGRHTHLTDAQLNAATAKSVRERRVTELFVYNLSRGTSLRVGIPAQ